MKNKFYAKSIAHGGETIVAHTKKLLSNFFLLKELYSDIKVNWDLLYTACLYHDLGKMNLRFQESCETNFKVVSQKDVPHGYLSTAFLPIELLKKQFTIEEIRMLAHAIAEHHDRNEKITAITIADFKTEIILMNREAESFPWEELGLPPLTAKALSSEYYKFSTRITPQKTEKFSEYMLLLGLLNRIDYAASGNRQIEVPNTFLESALSQHLCKKQLKGELRSWGAVQNFAREHRNENIVTSTWRNDLRTEVGMLWAGNQKIFYLMSEQSLVSSKYLEIKDDFIHEEVHLKISLLNDHVNEEYDQFIGQKQNKLYRELRREWGQPVAIATTDRVFKFVLKEPLTERFLATLAYSKIIIDELPFYSPDRMAYLIYGLKEVTSMGGNFMMLATVVPPFVIELLRQNDVPFIEADWNSLAYLPPEYQVSIRQEEICCEQILKRWKNSDNIKILVICNTVYQAQKVYLELKKEVVLEEIQLFHSQFIKKEYEQKKNKFQSNAYHSTQKKELWITTMIVEGMVTTDFDMVFTELSDLVGLYKRMEKCIKVKSFSEPNFYIFNGGLVNCSGVGEVIDKDFYQIAKRKINKLDGVVDGKKKLDLIKELYTLDTLRTSYSGYIRTVENKLTALKSKTTNKRNLKTMEEKKIFFEDKNTQNLIPKSVFEKHKKELSDLASIVENGSRADKKLAYSRISEYKVTLLEQASKSYEVKPIDLKNHRKMNTINIKYSDELGVLYSDLEGNSIF